MSEKKEKVKKAHYFTNKEIISMAIMAAAMFVVSCITVPLVLGVPFPGIRCLTCGLFFGIIIALDYAKVPKIGVGTLTTLVCSLPMVAFSWVILVFTTLSGVCTDIYFALIKKKLNVWTTIGLGIVLMGSMVIIAESMGILFVKGNTWASFSQFYSEGWKVAVGYIGSAILGGLGSFLATRIFKEFKGMRNGGTAEKAEKPDGDKNA
ncbi:MAG: hypothetical protein U0K37_06510 [Acutalibacteraceae bacterium]|nr:hypothetical protein [Acutalibacteraceae bacterium]